MPLRHARRPLALPPLALPLLAALLIGVPLRAQAPGRCTNARVAEGRLDVNDVEATVFANGVLTLYPNTLL